VVFAVVLHPKAVKALEKIEKSMRLRVVEGLRELRNRPERVGKCLKYSDFWSLRVGDYRVIYEVDGGKDQVVVLFIGHRKKVYDDFSKLF
jgi:mRNA interferase RelE/StbE